MTGFVVGGVIFGALGFLFAPQISAALLSEDQRLKLPKFLDEEEKDPEATKQARVPANFLKTATFPRPLTLLRIKCCTQAIREDIVCSLQDLADKIASLNAAIDDVSAQLKAQDSVAEPATSNATAS